MDEKYLELAAQFEQDQREEARRKVDLHNRPQKHPDFDGVHCIDCDDDIPAARLAMGKIRCVPCQTLEEK